jgi:hypothetical protein
LLQFFLEVLRICPCLLELCNHFPLLWVQHPQSCLFFFVKSAIRSVFWSIVLFVLSWRPLQNKFLPQSFYLAFELSDRFKMGTDVVLVYLGFLFLNRWLFGFYFLGLRQSVTKTHVVIGATHNFEGFCLFKCSN